MMDLEVLLVVSVLETGSLLVEMMHEMLVEVNGILGLAEEA